MTVREPKKRSNLRLKLGGAYFSAQRKLRWLSMRKHFARERSGEDLAYQAFSHHTPLMRKLKDVDKQNADFPAAARRRDFSSFFRRLYQIDIVLLLTGRARRARQGRSARRG